jgi:hypothetical protein
VALVKPNGYVFILDIIRERLDFPSLRRRVLEEAKKRNPAITLIEQSGSGTSLAQDLYGEIQVIPIGSVQILSHIWSGDGFGLHDLRLIERSHVHVALGGPCGGGGSRRPKISHRTKFFASNHPILRALPSGTITSPAATPSFPTD